MLAVRKGGKMSKDVMSDRDIRQLFRLIATDGGAAISINQLTAYVWGEEGFTKPERDVRPGRRFSFPIHFLISK